MPPSIRSWGNLGADVPSRTPRINPTSRAMTLKTEQRSSASLPEPNPRSSARTSKQTRGYQRGRQIQLHHRGHVRRTKSSHCSTEPSPTFYFFPASTIVKLMVFSRPNIPAHVPAMEHLPIQFILNTSILGKLFPPGPSGQINLEISRWRPMFTLQSPTWRMSSDVKAWNRLSETPKRIHFSWQTTMETSIIGMKRTVIFTDSRRRCRWQMP